MIAHLGPLYFGFAQHVAGVRRAEPCYVSLPSDALVYLVPARWSKRIMFNRRVTGSFYCSGLPELTTAVGNSSKARPSY